MGATSTRSNIFSVAITKASRTFMTPSCLPSLSITRTSLARISLLMRVVSATGYLPRYGSLLLICLLLFSFDCSLFRSSLNSIKRHGFHGNRNGLGQLCLVQLFRIERLFRVYHLTLTSSRVLRNNITMKLLRLDYEICGAL